MPWVQGRATGPTAPSENEKRRAPKCALAFPNRSSQLSITLLLRKVEINFPSNQEGRTNMKKYFVPAAGPVPDLVPRRLRLQGRQQCRRRGRYPDRRTAPPRKQPCRRAGGADRVRRRLHDGDHEHRSRKCTLSTATTTCTITYNFDSSGKCSRSSRRARTAILFVSAAPKQMDAVDGSLKDDAEKNPDGLDLIVTDSRVRPAGKQGDADGAPRAIPRALRASTSLPSC